MKPIGKSAKLGELEFSFLENLIVNLGNSNRVNRAVHQCYLAASVTAKILTLIDLETLLSALSPKCRYLSVFRGYACSLPK